MRTKTIELVGKPIEIKELTYLEFTKVRDLKDKLDEYIRKLFELSGVSTEVIDSLNVRDGDTLLKEIVEFNGFLGFQQTPTTAN